jgi:hypothetical protein
LALDATRAQAKNATGAENHVYHQRYSGGHDPGAENIVIRNSCARLTLHPGRLELASVFCARPSSSISEGRRADGLGSLRNLDRTGWRSISGGHDPGAENIVIRNSCARLTLHPGRLELGTGRVLAVEAAEEKLVDATEQAINLMRSVLENPEPIKNRE